MNRFIVPVIVFLALAGVLYVGIQHSPNKSTMVSAPSHFPTPIALSSLTRPES